MEFTNREHILLDLVCSSLWGTHLGWKGHQLSHGQFLDLIRLATQQALVGLVSQGLMDADVRMECREDALGLSEECFPLTLSDADYRRAQALIKNVIERGNFGHNVQYMKSHGVIHGMQHLWEMSKQTKTFYAYAPAEALWRIPEMFKWWGIKLGRMALRKQNHEE